MKILFLSSVYPHSTAPVRGTFNRELCRSLSKLAEVQVVSPLPWTERVKHPFAERAVDDNGLKVTYPTYFYTPKVMRNHYGDFMWKSIRKQVQRTLDGFQPDWVLSYWAHPDGEAGLRAAQAAGAQAGVIVGGSDILMLTDDPQRRGKIVDVLNQSDAVLPVSQALHRRATVLGTLPTKVHTIYQGIDPQVFKSGFQSLARQALNLTTTDRVFLWVGRMVGLKRLDRLIDAFAKVHKIESSAQLALVGDGPMMGEVRSRIERLGLQDNVLLPGGVSNEALGNWYRAADATVLASESEGLPNVLRESLACGTPFISTDVGSVSEIANDAYSIVVPIGDVDAMADAMTRIIHPSFQSNAGCFNARSWDDCARDFVTVMRGDTLESLGSTAHDPGIREKLRAENVTAAADQSGLEKLASLSLPSGNAATVLSEAQATMLIEE